MFAIRLKRMCSYFVNSIRNGSGGRSYALDFRGVGEYRDIIKQLKYETTPIMTRDEVRSGLAQKISLGLVYYLAETDMAETIQISVPKHLATHKSVNVRGRRSLEKLDIRSLRRR